MLRTSTEIERDYKAVLLWVRNLGSAEIFMAHIGLPGFAIDDMRKFVENFRKNLKLAGSSAGDRRAHVQECPPTAYTTSLQKLAL
jgi:hypothetical protein